MIRTMPTNCPASVNRAFHFSFLFFSISPDIFFPSFSFLTRHARLHLSYSAFTGRASSLPMTSRIDIYVMLTFTLRAALGRSWDSAESSRIHGDREMTADRIHATLFGSTQRGAVTAATPPSYIHGGVAACYVCVCVCV